MQKERWAGVVDTLGSHTLANACAQTRYGGAVAACGLAQGMDFPRPWRPFILRGVTLLGIDSVMAPEAAAASPRGSACRAIWMPARWMRSRRTSRWRTSIGAADELMDGKVRGRIVVDVNR